MICPKCERPEVEGIPECPKCGIVFAKYRRGEDVHGPYQTRLGMDAGATEPLATSTRERLLTRVLRRMVHVPDEVSLLHVLGRAALYAILLVWGLRFVSSSVEGNYAGSSFMHLVNLPFHEAGHFILGFFGRFVSVLGGSLMQLLVPLVCIVAFLSTVRDPYAASVSTWWLGESFIDLAPYINDARDLQLILLGGVTGREVEDYHDWQYLLGRLNLLGHDHVLARWAHGLGALLIGTAFLWGGYLLCRQFQRVLRQPPGFKG